VKWDAEPLIPCMRSGGGRYALIKALIVNVISYVFIIALVLFGR